MELNKPCFTKNQAKNDTRWLDRNFSCMIESKEQKGFGKFQMSWLNNPNTKYQSLNWIKQLTDCPSKLHVINFDLFFFLLQNDRLCLTLSRFLYGK